MIEEWGSAIGTRTLVYALTCSVLTCNLETAGMDSQAMCMPDGLTDDYESWDGEVPEVPRKNEEVLYVSNPQI